MTNEIMSGGSVDNWKCYRV